MLSTLAGNLFKKTRNFFSGKQIPKLSQVSIMERGAFDPYKVFSVELPWQKYVDGSLRRADLMAWEKLDRYLALSYRSMLQYPRYGLLHDDTVNDELPIVIEALNRLPPELKAAREKRIARAFELSLHNKILPKEEWTKAEDDVAYLAPYIFWTECDFEEHDQFKFSTRDVPPLPLQKTEVHDYAHGDIYKKRILQ